MDVLTLSFVGLLVIAAIFLTLNVRGQILRAAEARRQHQHQEMEEMRKRNAAHRNARSASRTNS